jgi:hypothetical protein
MFAILKSFMFILFVIHVMEKMVQPFHACLVIFSYVKFYCENEI